MTKKDYILDLMILSDDFNLLKNKNQTLKEYDQEKQKCYKRLAKLIMSLPLNKKRGIN